MTTDRIETTDHGGDLDAARRRFPAAPQPWIDLSTGINPHACPLPSLDPEMWRLLPQSAAQKSLLDAAARRYGAESAEMVVAASGSQVLIQVLPRVLDPTDVAVLSPTYAEHAISWARCGHRVAERTSPQDIGAARVVVVVNPNNPTGHFISVDELIRIAVELEDRRGLLIVDEAFIDFTPQASLVPRLPPSAIVLRSFGKAYGLGGLRLGFAIARPALARRVRAELGPWSVSGPALAIGAAALSDTDWLAAVGTQLAVDGARLDALLNESSLGLLGGTHLFRLAQHARAREIADVLGRHGIYVRRFSAQPEWLRFGIPGSEQAWHRLAVALAEAVRS
jgi:cobalamin biosynthetic protein CobC